MKVKVIMLMHNIRIQARSFTFVFLFFENSCINFFILIRPVASEISKRRFKFYQSFSYRDISIYLLL